MKETGRDSGLSGYLLHTKHVVIWLTAALVTSAIVLHLYFSYSSPTFYTRTSRPSPLPTLHYVSAPPALNHTSETAVRNHTSSTTAQQGVIQKGEKCDLFHGDWIPQPSGPYYTNESCRAIQEDQNCMKHGRPDSGYLYWKWKPNGCDVPRFDGKWFLKAVKNKVWGFIGDSIARNHVQSLLCLLSQVEDPMDIYHDEAYKFRRWYFPSYNFTLAVLWSPFLIKEQAEGINGLPSDQIKVHLDTIDEKWLYQLHEFDFVVLSGGKWFYKASVYFEKNETVGCHYCPGMNLTELGYQFAYRKALRLAFKFINTHPDYKGLTFFRTFTSDHFENGQWFSGGTCQRMVPFKKDQIIMDNEDAKMLKIELEEFEKAAKEGLARGLKFKLLDTSQVSLLRPDGHPGPYRYYYPFANGTNVKVQNDCLHWCLPGPIDTWSELMLEMLKHV